MPHCGVWYKNSQFHNAPYDPNVQFSYFLQAINDDVQTELQIGEDDIEAANALFPEQAEEMEIKLEECICSQLDAVFNPILHGLFEIR